MKFYRSCGVRGELYVRARPCVCTACLAEDWSECEIGGWKRCKLTPTKMRNPNIQHLDAQLGEADQSGYVVDSIVGQRVHNNILEYLVAWQGYTECTWTPVDQLSCYELIEDFEMMIEYTAAQSFTTPSKNK